ncbi:hypothetical protein V1478_011662 [Vespula squamosa]|uniref:Uncharacterized protein n=1 Tax=Vespula squamosa TaxID=30214 RepID=A0ABD2AF53_VESSQ
MLWYKGCCTLNLGLRDVVSLRWIFVATLTFAFTTGCSTIHRDSTISVDSTFLRTKSSLRALKDKIILENSQVNALGCFYYSASSETSGNSTKNKKKNYEDNNNWLTVWICSLYFRKYSDF